MKFGLDAVEQLEVSNAAIASSPLSSSYLRLNGWDWKTASLLLGPRHDAIDRIQVQWQMRCDE